MLVVFWFLLGITLGMLLDPNGSARGVQGSAVTMASLIPAITATSACFLVLPAASLYTEPPQPQVPA